MRLLDCSGSKRRGKDLLMCSKDVSDSKVAVKVDNLAKNYQLYARPQDRLWQTVFRGKRKFYHDFEALKPLSFEVEKGKALGIIGRNGSGKSTLLQLICGTLTPSVGSVTVNGRISALLELGAGFNPDFTGKENLYLNAAILGLDEQEIEEKYEAILDFSGIEDKIDQPVKTYSSGMYVRLAFSVAIATDPDVLIVDEALAVGDAFFQRKCYGRIREMQEKGVTILFVSHSENVVTETCDEALLLEHGELLTQGTPKHVFEQYNQLIFSTGASYDALKQSIKDGSWEKEKAKAKAEVKDGEAAIAVEGSESFDPNIQPKHSAYHTENVDISQVQLTTLYGDPINVLKVNGRYKICYQVQFKTAQKQVRFNYRIRTVTGVLLTGATSKEHDTVFASVEAGQCYEVEFEFSNRFVEGDYFIQIASTAVVDNQRVPLCRVDDALMYRVSPYRGIQNAGIVDMQPVAHVTLKEQENS